MSDHLYFLSSRSFPALCTLSSQKSSDTLPIALILTLVAVPDLSRPVRIRVAVGRVIVWGGSPGSEVGGIYAVWIRTRAQERLVCVGGGGRVEDGRVAKI